MRCGAVRCCAVRCCAVRCCAVRCGAVRCCAVLHPHPTFRCGHSFCAACAQKIQSVCPVCRRPLDGLGTPLVIFGPPPDPLGPALGSEGSNRPMTRAEMEDKLKQLRDNFSSPKIVGIMQKLREVFAAEPSAKVVVCTQWKQTQQMIAKVCCVAQVTSIQWVGMQVNGPRSARCSTHCP